ncbi:MAG: hypothetical protein IJW37_05555 [Lachnospiraceae bacterium]|nr:hypothetical protein [Lachnospiraceae bacterium]
MKHQVERNRRNAFLGLQLKYTMAPILWLYAGVFAVLLGLFLYNWVTTVKEIGGGVSFLEQAKALPLGIAFWILVMGVQAILVVGFRKQTKNELATQRIPLPEETQRVLRWSYSFLVTVSAFLFYFVMLCLLLLLENILDPSSAYGGAELYPVFYTFTHLYRIYPVANGMAAFALPIVVIGVSAIAPMTTGGNWHKWGSGVWIVFLCITFIFYCFENQGMGYLLLDLVCMVIYGVSYMGSVISAYRRRQKNDGAELI